MDQESPRQAVRWPMVRVASGSEQIVSVVTSRFVRLTTHFVGRTIICPGTDNCAVCDFCASRDLWYLAVRFGIRSSFGLLELSSLSAAEFEQGVRFSGLPSMLGSRVRLFRKSSRSPIRSEVLEPDTSTREIEACDWLSALMAIYQYPSFHRGESCDDYFARVVPIAVTRAKIVAERAMGASSN